MSFPEGMNERLLDSGTLDGIDWCIVQAPLWGGVNGYARLPEGHPWRELDLTWDDSDTVTVHGGITYGPTDEGWIGFDTMHAFDYWPEMDEPMYPGGPTMHICPKTGEDCRCTRWTKEMVRECARDLARDVKAADHG